MSTLEEYYQLLARLPPGVQEVIRQLFANGRTLSPAELLRVIYFLFGAANADQIQRILVLLARLGRLGPGVLQGAMELLAAGEWASATGAAGGAVAGGLTVAAILAILAALLAIVLAAYTISTEVMTEISYPGTGLVCASSAAASGTVWHLWRRAIGSRSAVQKVIDAAQAHCERIGTCSGECRDGRCRPVASFIRIDPRYRVFWTTAHAWYICSCQCVVD